MIDFHLVMGFFLFNFQSLKEPLNLLERDFYEVLTCKCQLTVFYIPQPKYNRQKEFSYRKFFLPVFYTYNPSSVVSIYHSIMLITFHLQKTVFFLIYYHNLFLLPSRRHKDFPGFPAIPRKAPSLLSRNRSVHLHIPDSGNLWRRRL